MKTILLCCCILSTITSAMCQVEQGNLALGGTLNVSYSSNKSGSNNPAHYHAVGFQGAPTVGYFIKKRWMVGGMASYNFTYSKEYNSTTIFQNDKTHQLFVGPFARYYPLALTKFALYIQSELTGTFGASSTSSYAAGVLSVTDNPATVGIIAVLRPGFSFFPINNLSIDLNIGQLGYVLTTQPSKSVVHNYLDAGIDLKTIRFGVQYYFHRKHKKQATNTPPINS